MIYRLHSNSTLGPQRNMLIRGVPATVYDEGRSIELYSGRVAIDIFSDTFAHALRGGRTAAPAERVRVGDRTAAAARLLPRTVRTAEPRARSTRWHTCPDTPASRPQRRSRSRTVSHLATASRPARLATGRVRVPRPRDLRRTILSQL